MIHLIDSTNISKDVLKRGGCEARIIRREKGREVAEGGGGRGAVVTPATPNSSAHAQSGGADSGSAGSQSHGNYGIRGRQHA